MTKINENYLKLPGSYLFAEIAKRERVYKAQNPRKKVISLGIGDVTRPLPGAVTQAMAGALAEMGREETFRGYGPYGGYDFLLDEIIARDYAARGVSLERSEIFVSDGSKCDCANIAEIFDLDNTVAVCDPVYPVYVDSNAMAGRAGDFDAKTGKWTKIVYMPCTEENNFIPDLPKEKCDLIYLCFPNNPTGAAASAGVLKMWVDYALKNGSVILYDGAYEAYITEDFPRSIYEIEGAKACAIEFRSFSKNAAFTGTRCAFIVIPKELKINGVSLGALWLRHQSTKFNGVAYIVQKGAAAVYSEQGRREIKDIVGYYLNNAKIISETLRAAGFSLSGGVNSPYIWLKTPPKMTSWEFFDRLLSRASVVGTPGSGFGPSGEGYFRLTAFGSAENTLEAVERIKNAF